MAAGARPGVEPLPLQRRLADASTTWVTWAFVVVFLAGSMGWFTAGPYAELSSGIPDEAFGQSEADLRAHIDGMGPEGRATYATFLVGDLFFGPALAVAALLLITRALRRTGRFERLHGLMVLPVVGAGFDVLENIGFLSLTGMHPGWDTTVAAATLVCNTLKLVATGASMALAVAAAVVLLWKAMTNPMGRRR